MDTSYPVYNQLPRMFKRPFFVNLPHNNSSISRLQIHKPYLPVVNL